MPHWKHTATRCAMPLCDRQRRKGWSTCGLYGHAERGVSLYGLAPKAPRLTELRDASGARVPDIGERVMHYVDYDLGTVWDRAELDPGRWVVQVRWDGSTADATHRPDELSKVPASVLDTGPRSL